MDIVCNPFPVDTDIQDIVPAGNFSVEGGDWIMWWDAEKQSYTTAVYWGEEMDGGVYETEDYEVCLGAGWGDPSQVIVTGMIPSGKGFWSQAVAGGSLVFKNPLANK